MTKSMFRKIKHYYKQNRLHQMAIANDGGGSECHYPEGKVEISYGGAAYGEHAYCAFMSAKRHIHFMTSRGLKA